MDETGKKKHISIGICGHTDHGKTTLVKLLTNQPSRKNELPKDQGVTVEMTVSPYPVSDAIHAALIDVPGHHHYLKNAMRALYAVDMAVLVVAADDGVMPQTIEHIELLSSLGIHEGFTVLSKTDLVDDELYELAVSDVRDALKNTVFKNKPIVSYASVHGKGLEKIRAQIENEARRVCHHSALDPFRLWIDKVKQHKGFGTVVCGTVISGKISVDQPVYLFPPAIKTKARTIESHHEKMMSVSAGQRAGINIPKISAKNVKAGMLMSGSMAVPMTRYLNVRVKALKEIKDHQRIKLFIGTSFVKALFVKIADIDSDMDKACFVQLRTTEDIPCFVKENFILLRLDNNQIVGQGECLEISSLKYRVSKKEETVFYLSSVFYNRKEDMVRGYLNLHRQMVATPETISYYTGIDQIAVDQALKNMLFSGELIQVQNGYYLKKEYEKRLQDVILIFKDILSGHPARNDLNRETVYSRLKYSMTKELFQWVFSDLVSRRRLIETGTNTYALKNFSITLSGDQKRLVDLLLNHADQSGLSPFTMKTVYDIHHGRYERNRLKELLDFLCNEEKIVRLDNDRYISRKAIEDIKIRVNKAIELHGKLNLTDSKKILGYGRTKGAAVFDYLDEIGFTYRVGNDRLLVDKAF